MNDLQRKLWLAWIEADRAQIAAASRKSGFPSGTSADVLFEATLDFYEAHGIAEGLRKACIIAEVPNFTEE